MGNKFFNLGMDFISAIIVSGIIGYGIDWLFSSTPWGLIVFIIFGFAAGILTIFRRTGGL